MRWGTVTAVSPLRVKLDGDSAALGFAPDSLVDPAALAVDDRVRCELSNRRLVIVGRSGGVASGAPPVGTHLAGEWATAPDGYVLADGSTLNIADWPLLAAHYADVYGTVDHHGGDGATTFATPDTRERTYVNQGGSDVFADIGGVTGNKNHEHTLSDSGQARITVGAASAYSRQVASQAWTANFQTNGSSGAASTLGRVAGAALTGETDEGSTVQPSFVCRYIIRAD